MLEHETYREAAGNAAERLEGIIVDGVKIDQPVKVLVHLTSGQTVEFLAGDDDHELDDDELLENLLKLVKEPPRPHWVTFGDAALVFTQSIAAIELA